MKFFLAFSLLLGSAKTTFAYNYCSEPNEPYCVDGSGYFDDQYAADNCRYEVEAFVSDVNEYIDCLQQQREDAASKAEEIIRKFNCRINGETICY